MAHGSVCSCTYIFAYTLGLLDIYDPCRYTRWTIKSVAHENRFSFICNGRRGNGALFAVPALIWKHKFKFILKSYRKKIQVAFPTHSYTWVIHSYTHFSIRLLEKYEGIWYFEPDTLSIIYTSGKKPFCRSFLVVRRG